MADRRRRTAGRGPRLGGAGEDVRAGAGRPGRRRRVRIQRCPRSRGGSAPSSRGATIERLFGVGKVRAAGLMTTFGAELVGNQKALPRTKLLQQLKKHRGRAAFRHAASAWPPSSPEGPADRGPVQGARREHEREAGEPARWGVGRARADRGAVRRGGGRPGAALNAGPGDRERSGAVPGARRSLSRWGRGGEGNDGGSGAGGRDAGGRRGRSRGGDLRLGDIGLGRARAASGDRRCGADGWRRSRRSTSPPTSGRTRGRPRPSSSIWPRSACSATGSSPARRRRRGTRPADGTTPPSPTDGDRNGCAAAASTSNSAAGSRSAAPCRRCVQQGLGRRRRSMSSVRSIRGV